MLSVGCDSPIAMLDRVERGPEVAQSGSTIYKDDLHSQLQCLQLLWLEAKLKSKGCSHIYSFPPLKYNPCNIRNQSPCSSSILLPVLVKSLNKSLERMSAPYHPSPKSPLGIRVVAIAAQIRNVIWDLPGPLIIQIVLISPYIHHSERQGEAVGR